MECATALRNLKLLEGSGGLDFDTSHGFLDKPIAKPLFGSASHLANMGSGKAVSPTSNPQRLKGAKS